MASSSVIATSKVKNCYLLFSKTRKFEELILWHNYYMQGKFFSTDIDIFHYSSSMPLSAITPNFATLNSQKWRHTHHKYLCLSWICVSTLSTHSRAMSLESSACCAVFDLNSESITPFGTSRRDQPLYANPECHIWDPSWARRSSPRLSTFSGGGDFRCEQRHVWD